MPEDVDAGIKEEASRKIPTSLKVTLLEHQSIGLSWMRNQERGMHRGGILADDMGLGKTIQAMALILGGVEEAGREQGAPILSTLIVAPLALVHQWVTELEEKTVKGTLRVCVHHGPKRGKSSEDLEGYDVVITTYNLVASEFPSSINNSTPSDVKESILRKSDSTGPLFRYKWGRVILDESQMIKNHETRVSIACCHLEAKYRWCLSGTPIQNGVGDMYPLFKFLHVPEISDFTTFNAEILIPIVRNRPHEAIRRLQAILKFILLRRKKTTRINGKMLIQLPARTINHLSIPLSPFERTFYDGLKEQMRCSLKVMFSNSRTGPRVTNVLAMLIRLRQACCHVLLCKNFVGIKDIAEALGYKNEQGKEEVGEKARDESWKEDDLALRMEMLSVGKARRSRTCSVCASELSDYIDGTLCEECIHIIGLTMDEPSTETCQRSTKIKKMLQVLESMRETYPKDKCIIFSQWTSLLDLVEGPVRKAGFSFERYDGSMSSVKREQALESFRTDPSKKVLLISLMSGSVGLNLTSANHVILLDIWFNPAVEEQAIDRVHRIGQTKPVFVTKITIRDSVEDRIIWMQKKKRSLAEGALKGTDVVQSGGFTLKELIELLE
ncbi:SNF2 family N-terminal domain-containing protein [Piptocephalis cylindrospora]|uniref:SNF2 family N-terminal domain-containing protein n=1 Tax=Piptocephalis cylindrospora TaxID=1907219 RepID=A0A4P9Y3P0_9FUNG|nr:SNF2 family N-terminal domain-containing protein [Piptocephalis cylindrospora]|eukprot:RKP13546.1 SNF2 family N-terminal domain-containing protein [Piptocephalis cylindrospora]